MDISLNRLRSLWGTYRKAIDDISVGMVQQGSVAAIAIISSILVARAIGPDKLGILTLTLSVVGIAGALTDLGIGQTAIRYGARAIAQGRLDEAHKTFRWAIRIRFLLVLVVVVPTYLLAPYLGIKLWKTPELVPLIRWSLLLAPIASITTISMAYFQAHKRFRTNALVVIGRQVIELSGILALALLVFWSVKAILFVKILCGAIGAFVFLVLLPRDSLFSLKDFSGFAKKGLIGLLRHPAPEVMEDNEIKATSPDRFATYLMVSTLFVIIILRSDAWFLGAYCTNAEVGIYGVALRFTLPLIIFTNALNAALLPRVAGKTTTSTLFPLLKQTFRISAAVAAGGLIYALVAPLAAPYLFGQLYASSVHPAQLLCLAYVLAMLICPIGVVAYYGLEMVRYLVVVSFIQLVSSLILYSALIPRYNALGAAMVILAVNFIGAILNAAGVIVKVRSLREKQLRKTE